MIDYILFRCYLDFQAMIHKGGLRTFRYCWTMSTICGEKADKFGLINWILEAIMIFLCISMHQNEWGIQLFESKDLVVFD